MSKQVWKYLLVSDPGAQALKLPLGAKLLHVGPQGKRLGLWFEVDIEEKKEQLRTFRVFGTGHAIEGGTHVGTVVITPYVWHVYEE